MEHINLKCSFNQVVCMYFSIILSRIHTAPTNADSHILHVLLDQYVILSDVSCRW